MKNRPFIYHERDMSDLTKTTFVKCRIKRAERETLTNAPPTFSLTAMTVEREMMNMNVMVKDDVLQYG